MAKQQKMKMHEWTHEYVNKLIKIDFIRFGIVGTTGFIVTVIGKAFATHILHLRISGALFFGSEVAVFSNFAFHETWTYKYVDHHDKSLIKKFIHFQLSSISGVLLFTAIGWVVAKVLGKDTFIGLVIAAGLTMFWNFFWTKFFIFKGKTPAALLNPEDSVAVETK